MAMKVLASNVGQKSSYTASGFVWFSSTTSPITHDSASCQVTTELFPPPSLIALTLNAIQRGVAR
jgi:hypothetical protein